MRRRRRYACLSALGYLRRAVCTAVASVASLYLFMPPAGADEGREAPIFEKSVQPLLNVKCVKCHGEKAKKADLDLRTPAGIRKGSESGPVIAVSYTHLTLPTN